MRIIARAVVYRDRMPEGIQPPDQRAQPAHVLLGKVHGLLQVVVVQDEGGRLVFTLEPGLYDPQAGYGVRLEDLCDLGGTGLEILTDLPYALDPRAWT